MVVFIAYTALSFIFPAENKTPHDVGTRPMYSAANFFLLSGLFPIEPMTTVTWSPSYEMIYYLVTPLSIVTFGPRTCSRQLRGTLGSVPLIIRKQ